LSEKGIFLASIDVGILLGKSGKDSEEAIKVLLELFESHKIPATWAIVGCLFVEFPSTMKRIIDLILNSSCNHEIGYHSFTHINFSQRGRNYAEYEIEEGLKIAKQYGISMRSFVYPHNAVGHMDVLKENRFIIYRSKDISFANASQGLISRFFCKGIDHFLSDPVTPKWHDGIWEIPSSMYFSDSLLPFTLLMKAKSGVNKAISSGKVFHIWLHPQDLIHDPLLARRLDLFLHYVEKKINEGRLQATTMGDLGLMLNKNSPPIENDKKVQYDY